MEKFPKYPKVVTLAFFSFFFILYFSCKENKPSELEEFGNTFFINLYDKNYEAGIRSMDALFADSVSKSKLGEGIIALSDKIRDQFETRITTDLISSEKTIHEGLPSDFLIFKVHSKNRFAYYFLYINEATKKILLVSEFSRVKEKR